MLRPEHINEAHGFRNSWRAFCHNPHVRTECNALIFLLIAVCAMLAGLLISPVVCGAFALIFFGSDLYSWWHDRS